MPDLVDWKIYERARRKKGGGEGEQLEPENSATASLVRLRDHQLSGNKRLVNLLERERERVDASTILFFSSLAESHSRDA